MPPIDAEPSARDPIEDPALGTTLDERYVLTALLGRGGMGSVYRADDRVLGRTVAVKLFAAPLTASGDLRRELGEIRTLASVNHYALVTLFDARVTASATSDQAFLVMEYIDGPSLRVRLERGPIAAVTVSTMAVDLAEALQTVHARSVVHRDIKPDNVLLSLSPDRSLEFRAKLADFGIALLSGATRLTQPGTVIGTAAYLSPEQARGAVPGPATDIYSLGLLLLESLTGRRAFPGTILESVAAKLTVDPEIPDSLGAEWKPLLQLMTARAPELRPSAQQVADAVRRFGAASALTIDEQATKVHPAVHEQTEAYTPTKILPASELSTTPAVRPRRALVIPILIVVLVVLVGSAITAAIVYSQIAVAPTTPALPALGGDLGLHLRQLMQSVSG